MSKSNATKTPKSIENESENENVSRNHQIPLLPPHSTSRSPLNAIPDPSQSSGSAPTPARVWGVHKGKPNSATSTPTRPATSSSSSSRVSNVYNRNLHLRGASVSRSNSAANADDSLLHVVPHFELLQDPSFWADHNVQVLIRIRPLSNMEKVLQGYGTCLKQESAQTLVWLGHPENRFTFDHVACQTISQEKLFMVAGLPMVDNCMSGYNSCMFAYGQTGSGKTYTMMGEIGQMDGKLDEHCGITPRIFEYLFTRIKEDEEIRRSEGLKYSCKCSFLEIYNEQITDLLEPSSTNLQLREDLKKGVYVENLSEYDVRSANDVISLLREGAANRKMAATHMNSESSRSHSVFTCIIESSWEKDSMTHFRFARLNLVDLAGSERQKSSGAEGDRLKEAANINKSLSILGLVIMSLVDLAHGKQRHVPYRDSRLTFLLQDSLGGNSKTTIIANVSPSICSANETLSTLKFAQRAKLIQNNAKVNEDASGDVTALQRQIQLLKGQLNLLMKHRDPLQHRSNCLPSTKESRASVFLERCDSVEDMMLSDDDMTTFGRDGKVKRLKTTLLGALRREKLAEVELRRLKTELEQMKCLVHQREKDAELNKMMLTFQEERIKSLELCADGLLSADKYLLGENNALTEEIQVLQARTKNPDITKLELENAGLLQQIKQVQNFYEQGEREQLLAELSNLRDQFLELLEAEGCYWQPQIIPVRDTQSNVAQELEECRDMNSRLIREADELQRVLDRHMKCNQDESDSVQALSTESSQLDDLTSHKLQENQLLFSNKNQVVDTISILQFKDIEKQLVDARFLMETMESKQARLVEEIEFLRDENHRLTGMLNKKEMERQPGFRCKDYDEQSSSAENQHLDLEILGSQDISKVALQANLDKLSKDLQEALSLNSQYLQDHASRLSQDHQIESVLCEVEMETAKTILYLQQELVVLQSDFEERLCTMAEENAGLRKTLEAKDDEISALSAEWEMAILELTSFLLDGSKSLQDASSQIEGIASSFPQAHVWLREHVEWAAKLCVQKEETILLLQHSLEDAQKTVVLMNQKLNSLKGATIALSEVEQQDNDISNEISQLKTAFDGDYLQRNVKCRENHTAEAACSAKKMMSDHPAVAYKHNIEVDMTLTDIKALASSEVDIVDELVRQAQLETSDALNAFFSDAETYLSALKSDIQEALFIYKDLLQDLLNDIREARRNCFDLKVNGSGLSIHTCGIPCGSHKFINHGDQQQLLHQLKDELVKANDRLNTVNAYFYKIVNLCGSPEREEESGEAVRLNTDCPTSFSNHSADCVASGSRSNGVCFMGYECPVRSTDLNLEFEERSIVTSYSQESEKLDREDKSLNHDELLVCFRNEFKSVYGVFSKLNTQLDGFFTEKDDDSDAPGLPLPALLTGVIDNNHGPTQDGHDQPIMPESSPRVQYHELITQKANGNCNSSIKLDAGKKFTQPTSFFTKIEEAHATMKEADHMLKTLLKANENAKQLSLMWKQAGEELQFEKASLIEEIQQLRSSLSLREGENEILQDHIWYSLSEIVHSIASLEGEFEYMQKYVEEFYKVAYFDALRTVKETLACICSSRVMLEEIFTKAMESDIISFFLESHVKDFFKKIRSITNYDLCPITVQYEPLEMNAGESYTSCEDHSMFKLLKWEQERDETATVRGSEGGESTQVRGDPENGNLELKKELERKEVLLKGLLFDFRLLQESASSRQDFKDEFEKLLTTLNKVKYELQKKTSELDELLLQHRALEERLSETENAVTSTKSDLEHARRTSDILSEQNADFRLLLKDIFLKKSEAEEQLEEQREVIKSLEEEILRMTSSMEKQLASSVKEDDLRRVTEERDKLLEQLQSLQMRLDMAFALAEENEAIAVESRQESEASKMYAEQKEEEVKILEHSVEELECTINVLEKKVYEMENEVQRQHVIRESLELEIQALTDRLSTVENLTENLDSEDSSTELSKGHKSRYLEIYEAQRQIRILEGEKAELVKEIKQCKEYVSELVLHAEAQASQYQEKYKYLEAMFCEAKMDSSKVTYAVQTSDKTEKTSTRSRGSGSPFRCISNLVQQMNSEKDQELSIAKVRVEELEAMAASRQKEVCVLHSRLAAAESMTHDVIRDLLGVKIDMTNFANLADQYQLQKLVEDAQQQKQESARKEKELSNLRRQLVDLTEDRERCISEVHRREADVLAAQMTLERLKERDQLLTAQNEMLKVDKTNLRRRIAELDDMVKRLFGTQDVQPRDLQTIDLCRGSSSDVSQRVGHSGKQLLQVDDLHSRPRRLDCTLPHRRRNGHEK